MFSIDLVGGLGNQMFIYAFAKAIEKKGYPIRLLTRHYAYSSLCLQPPPPSIYEKDIRNAEIFLFDLKLSTDIADRISKTPISSMARRILRKIQRELGISASVPSHHIVTDEDPILKQENFPSMLPTDTHFQGYFQDIAYFRHIREDLLRDFCYRFALSSKNQELQERIRSTPNSVFLHIRRGDYLHNGNWMFVQLGSTYYENALRIVKNEISNPHIFVFSNEITWCKKHFLANLSPELKEGLEFSFIEGNGEGNAVEEMELMRSCSNAIIANSTFSWWAAYLIEDPMKIIVSPAQYHYYEKILDKLIFSGRGEEGDGKWLVADLYWKQS